MSDGSSVTGSLSGTAATATITPTGCGCEKNTVTLANREIHGRLPEGRSLKAKDQRHAL